MGLALAAMVIPAAYAQLQPTPKRMVAMSVPAHVDAVHGTANVKLHLDAGALPTTFKVTTKGAGMSLRNSMSLAALRFPAMSRPHSWAYLQSGAFTVFEWTQNLEYRPKQAVEINHVES